MPAINVRLFIQIVLVMEITQFAFEIRHLAPHFIQKLLADLLHIIGLVVFTVDLDPALAV